MLQHVYFNGDYVPAADARLHASDLGTQRGYGVFDYFRIADGYPRFFNDHLKRFQSSAEGIGLSLPITADELTNIIEILIRQNEMRTGGIRCVLTGGYAEDLYTPVQPNLLVLPYGFTPPPEELYSMGCSVMLHAYERQLPRVKSIDYLEGIRIQPMLRKHDAQFPLYVDRDGNVRESDRSNFMIVRAGVLIAPVDDILLGITRKHLLQLAGQLDIPVEERAVRSEEVLSADEALICSSVKGAMAITRVDGRPVGDGNPGPVTLRLMEAWAEYA